MEPAKEQVCRLRSAAPVECKAGRPIAVGVGKRSLEERLVETNSE